jgi:hypothetical protein
MEFVLLLTGGKGAPAPEPAGFEEMGKFAAELASRGILRRGAPLARADEAVCVRMRGDRALVSDGPFAESKEVIGGFWVIDVATREAAIEIASRCPHARHGRVEVHRLAFRGVFRDVENGRPFLLVFRMEPGLQDPDGAKGREMQAFGEDLVRDATLFETGRLASAEAPAVVELRGGRPLVTDGPFAESKEAIGGYGLVRVASSAEAIEQAQRWPHARWGPVEVREILFFDPV